MNRVQIFVLLLFVVFIQSANAIEDINPPWEVSVSKKTSFHTDGREAVINVSLKSSKKHRILVRIQILIEGNEAYFYTGNYWENINKEDAKKQITYIVEDSKIENCSKLEPEKSDWAEVYLKVTEKEYQSFRSSSCKIFTHNLSFEHWRSIVFRTKSSKGVIASEFGV